jgi:hypothetical protein
MAPATTRPGIVILVGSVGERKRWDDLKKDWARLYAKKRVAFSAMAPRSGGERP